jgi:hypothetical protein
VCGREFRSQPDFVNTVKQDLGKSALGGFLRKVPLVGDAVAENVVGEDPRYSYKMSQTQLESAWKQVQVHFRECPTCSRIVCLSDFDTQAVSARMTATHGGDFGSTRRTGWRSPEGICDCIWVGRRTG